MLVHAAGTYATVLRKAPNNFVIIMMPSKKEFCLPAQCMCTVGKLSNVESGSTSIGSAGKNRELGNRSRSGLWQRKKGCHGRKIRRPPPVRTIVDKPIDNVEPIQLTLTRPFIKNLNKFLQGNNTHILQFEDKIMYWVLEEVALIEEKIRRSRN
ncbi:39S ribosomal protein L2, mitochondrial-like [Diabrotica virgifera virgifera]|uniref:Large ribosomal subunit protein uL2 C-terminal domain-containing protein n=1 Tax=Diabrotica virgifera virgifera TaxID=50390 RepID=A0ABM5JSR4_DIAVI|nr:39S ribosomal protein L2, mitochondrial-like [Diabrotica virgifera virgifera]